MNTNQDLETQLRASFNARAQDISHAPQWVPSAAPVPPGWRSPRVWAPLAAAACIGALVAGILVARSSGTDHTANQPTPAPSSSRAPSPTGSPSPTASHSKSAPVPEVLSTCSTTLPAAWQAALATASVDAGGYDNYPLSVTPDGALLALRDDGPAPGLARDVVELRPGQSPTVLYSVPDPDKTSVASADEVGHWLLLGLKDQPRYPKGEIPGSSSIGLSGIAVVDLHTGHFTQIATTQNATGGMSIQSSAVFDGQIYWDEESHYGNQTGVVKSYDPSTGTTRTVYTGAIGYLTVSPAGIISDIQSSPVVIESAALPPIVAAAMTPFSRFRISSDGTAYAWLTSPTVVGWWRPGMTKPTYVRLKTGLNTEGNGGAPTIAGQFLITFAPTQLVDMTSKAVAQLSAASFRDINHPYLMFSDQGLIVGGGEAAGNGKFVGGYWEDPAVRVLRLDTAALPDLSC